MPDLVDDNGYPTEELLTIVRNWSPDAGYDELLEFIKNYWRYGDCGYWSGPIPYKWFSEEGVDYDISTAGWSGNEDIIGALKDNQIFWLTCWYKSQRGGHYTFRVSNHFKKETRHGKE